MVIRRANSGSFKRGWMTTDLVVAMGILTVTMLPLAFSFVSEIKLCRGYYYRAVAMEIVDGEMEILAAGEWRAFRHGDQSYPIRAESAKVLPPGRFRLTVEGESVRLEWLPDKRNQGGRVVREAKVK